MATRAQAPLVLFLLVLGRDSYVGPKDISVPEAAVVQGSVELSPVVSLPQELSIVPQEKEPVEEPRIEPRSGIRAGGFELTLEASIFSRSGPSESLDWNVGGEFGYFLTDHWELVLSAKLSGSGTDEQTTTSGDLLVGIRYYFWPQERLTPFVGARAGLGMRDSASGDWETEFAFGADAGILWFLGQDRRWGLRLDGDVLFSADDLDHPRVGLMLGISRFF